MKILLTGATGYIGKRLLPLLLKQGHEVTCCVRDARRFPVSGDKNLHLFEVDFLQPVDINTAPREFDAAYYLIHSMSAGSGDFETLEKQAAQNFVDYVQQTSARQVIYLGGIISEEALSKHLRSRKNTEEILRGGSVPLTAIRAGIIVGSGSASFEIIRDLVEKLPVMITPKWLNTKGQPIAVRNVLQYLTGVLLRPETFGGTYDIGGPEILSYKQMLLQFAEVRNLRRYIFTVPVMTPRLSSYWLYFVTSTSYSLAVHLVNSMKITVVCKDNSLQELLGIQPIVYREAVRLAVEQIEHGGVLSSWKDAYVSSAVRHRIGDQIVVPEFGCYIDRREAEITTDVDGVTRNIWSIGGSRGWYYANLLWGIRGFIDKLFGGTGLRRGRRSPEDLHPGDAVDFWRVIVADKENRRLLLFAEMKLPGEAWLEFQISQRDKKFYLRQTATFRPRGLWGRMYWYSISPFHHLIFEGMLKNLIEYKTAG